MGLFGYPNVGKSSVINCIVGKKACDVAPIPGQTKIWQYVSLFDKFYLIDCPGVVYPRPGDGVVSSILRSVVRVQQIESPEEYVGEIVKRIRPEYLQRMYEVESWEDEWDFMRQLANKWGKLWKGGEPDWHNVSIKILHDWQRGKLPWFICPPFEDDLELEFKLRNEQKRLEEEMRAFVEDKEIDFQPVDTMAVDGGEGAGEDLKENNADDLDRKEVAMTHEFGGKDMDETKYRKEMAEKEKGGGEEVNEDLVEIEAMSKEERERFDRVKVDNPFDLSNDDPLLIRPKLKKWKKLKEKGMKRSPMKEMKRSPKTAHETLCLDPAGHSFDID